MGHERQPRDDVETRQKFAEQWEIVDFEAGKPSGSGPPPVQPPDGGRHDPSEDEATGGWSPPK
jgi:hypothetical protein